MKKLVSAPGDALARIHLPRAQPILQVLGRQIDVHDLIGQAEDVVRDALLDLDPGAAFHDVIETFEMLNVQGGDDVDAGLQQFLHVLITLAVAAARGVGVGQFVHQGHLRPTSEDGVEVHFFQHDAAILDAPPRHLLQIAHLCQGVGPAMRFDDADDDVDALLFEALRFLQHLVGLADAGREAQINLEPAPLLFADQRKESLRRRPVS